MKRVTGIGGIFFQSADPVALRTWYQKHLGVDVQAWGGAEFKWADPQGATVWSISNATSTYFAPSTASFMINYRVPDLHGLVQVLKEEGCNVLDKIEESEFGKFAWVMDPDGNKVELWQPPTTAT